jgi:hypothetical protein
MALVIIYQSIRNIPYFYSSCMYPTGELSMKIGELMDEKFPSNDVTTVTT